MIRPVLTAALLTAAYFAAATGVAVFIGRRLKRWADAREHDARAVACEPCNGEEGPHTCGRKLPGPGRHQAGRWPDGDTGIHGWTPGEIAYLRGETDTLPTATDIPEENPS